MSNSHVVKRQGHTEPFDERKLYASVYSICLSVRATPADAELIANSVCKDVKDWLADKPEVTSHDVRNHAARQLERYNPDAAYLFTHHHKLQ